MVPVSEQKNRSTLGVEKNNGIALPSQAEVKRALAQALRRADPKPTSHPEARSVNVRPPTRRAAQEARARYPHLFEFYCPLCGNPKRLPFAPKPGFRHMLQVGLTALVITLAAWSWTGIKGFVSFVPLWMVFESVYRLRVRARMQCGQCGFDPYLYLVDVKRARDQVHAHWQALYESRGLKYPPENKPWWAKEEAAPTESKTDRPQNPSESATARK